MITLISTKRLDYNITGTGSILALKNALGPRILKNFT